MKKIKYILIIVLIFVFSGSFVSADTNVNEYTITVNKATNCVTVYKLNDSGSYEPFKAMICSVGADNGTPSGSFKTQAKYTWRPLFGDVYGQYATRINGNILFHSVYYKTTSPDTLKADEYNKLGTAASMGCVRLTVADAKWIYDNCPIGTRVNITDNGYDPLPRPRAIKLGVNASYPNWDPTDPNPNNPWKNEGIKFNYQSLYKTVKSSDGLTSEKLAGVIRYGVTAYDTANNPVNFLLAYNIEPTTPGTYEVKYYATDVLGNYGEITGYLTIE
ncbi:MAG: L,D-transpeptidase [Clostridia bacterium]|nr:L,D-transpeptidase [Clostridia bacterium]